MNVWYWLRLRLVVSANKLWRLQKVTNQSDIFKKIFELKSWGGFCFMFFMSSLKSALFGTIDSCTSVIKFSFFRNLNRNIHVSLQSSSYQNYLTTEREIVTQQCFINVTRYFTGSYNYECTAYFKHNSLCRCLVRIQLNKKWLKCWCPVTIMHVTAIIKND